MAFFSSDEYPTGREPDGTEGGRECLVFGKRQEHPAGPRVSTRLCTDSFNGKYPHVGLYDTRERKNLGLQAAQWPGHPPRRTRGLITGADNATSTVWKDRFICYWFLHAGAPAKG